MFHWAGLFFGPGEWACAPILQTLLVAPQPLCTVCVGKGYIVSHIGCNFHVFARGWVSYGFVVILCFVIMMNFWFSRSFLPLLSVSFVDTLRPFALCAPDPKAFSLLFNKSGLPFSLVSEPYVQSPFLESLLR